MTADAVGALVAVGHSSGAALATGVAIGATPAAHGRTADHDAAGRVAS